MRIAIFSTCLVDAVSPDAGVSVVRVLRRLGHEVELLEDATCCGQPAWNSGQVEAAAKVAGATLRAMSASDADAIVVPAGSCATMVRHFWPELFELAGDATAAARARALVPRTFEFSELVAADEALAVTSAIDHAVVYHHSCHMLRELDIKAQPVELLDGVAADRRVSSAEGRCCGFGGLFAVKLPELSTAMADDLLDAAVAVGAAEVVGCDSSCLMHLSGRASRRQLPLRFRHLAEVLDEASAPSGS